MTVVYISPHGKRFMSLAGVKKYIQGLPVASTNRLLFIYLSIYSSIYLSTHLFIYIYTFFLPIYQFIYLYIFEPFLYIIYRERHPDSFRYINPIKAFFYIANLVVVYVQVVSFDSTPPPSPTLTSSFIKLDKQEMILSYIFEVCLLPNFQKIVFLVGFKKAICSFLNVHRCTELKI